MTLARPLKYTAALLAAVLLLAVLLIALVGWNWLRGPIERLALEKTGRVLSIKGDLSLHFAWPSPRLETGAVAFANPVWAREKQMLVADAAQVAIDLPQLLRRNIVLPEVRLVRPVVFLEKSGDGRKTWLLDHEQQDEDARIRIDRLTIDRGTLGYDDVAQKTSIRAELSTPGSPTDRPAEAGVVFTAHGQYKGLALKASGSGGPVLALRDEKTRYGLKVDATIGRTRVRADGGIVSLIELRAIDMHLALAGDSLEQLYALLGIALPATRAYSTEGRLVHEGSSWRYQKFSGRIGGSDIAGTLTVDTAGKRPALTADLVSRVLDLDDLGPLIGARPGSVSAARQAALSAGQSTGQSTGPSAGPSAGATPARARLLPELPFNTDRWGSVDAEVDLKAGAIRRAMELPLEGLVTHLSLRDSVLKLDPLRFGLAGGDLRAVITLDGRHDPIRASANLRATRVQIARLFPAFALGKNSVGQVNGEFDLAGQGNSVARMLASASGNLGLVVSGGAISKLMMEQAGLHLWEILELNLAGDRLVELRCVVADFQVRQGNMAADALVFDTAVTTIIGSGNIDLGRETLDLTLNQRTKNTSPLALRSPIHVHGSFASPVVEVDKAFIAARVLGAVALGMVNPLLALIPLIDAGPGRDSDCGQLVRDARAQQQAAIRPASVPK